MATQSIPRAETKLNTRNGIFPIALVTLVVVILHNVVHEGGHALAAKALGYDVITRINHLEVVGGRYANIADAILVSAAGPLVTLGVAIAAWMATRRFPISLTIVGAALAMRIVAAVASLSYPNDEARISLALGLGRWTIFAVLIASLAALFVSLYRRKPKGWRWWLGSYIGASIGFAFNVLGEPYLPALSF